MTRRAKAADRTETSDARSRAAGWIAAAAGLAATLAAAGLLSGAAGAQTLNDPEVSFAGLPDEAQVEAWADQGVTRVVTLLTPEETAAMDYDLPNAVASEGMIHSWIPTSRQSGDEVSAYLADVLARAEGPVAIHCRSGTRASHAYAAALIREGVIEPGELDRIDPDREWREDLVDQLAP